MAVGQKPGRGLTPQKGLPWNPAEAAGWGEPRGRSCVAQHCSFAGVWHPNPASLLWTSLPAPHHRSQSSVQGGSCPSLLWPLTLCSPSELLQSSAEHRAVWVGDTCVPPHHEAAQAKWLAAVHLNPSSTGSNNTQPGSRGSFGLVGH